MRKDGRRADDLRPVSIKTGFLSHPLGSCLIEMGGTRVVCSAMLEDHVPFFLKGSGKGWLTAEYSMLPASSNQRVNRERNKLGGRTSEIQRLIGRSLRSCLDLEKLGERSILIDCDVLDADGGTRTASITGGYVALVLLIRALKKNVSSFNPASIIKTKVAAVSVGVVNGEAYLDLNYEEDKNAEVDMNIVKIADDRFIEIQGTSESNPFGYPALESLLQLAGNGIKQLFIAQEKALSS